MNAVTGVSATSAVLAFYALPTSISFVPLTLYLASLVAFISHVKIQPNGRTSSVAMFVCMSALGASLARVGSSVSALSTPTLSLMTLYMGSLTSILCFMAPISLWAAMAARVESPIMSILLFPSLWATSQTLIAHASSIGRLASWTPVYGIDGLRWLLPIFGASALDWAVGISVMLVVQFLELAGLIPALLFRRLPTTEFVPAPYADERSSLLEWPNGAPATTGVNAGEQHSEHHTKPAVLIQSQGWGSIPYTPLLFTAICLLALITPPSVAPFSFNVYPLPSPHNDDTILSLACIMPEFDPSTSKRGVFEAYRAESASINGQAKIHLWPEGAVRWDTAQERAADIQTLQNSIKVNSGYVIALGFEDFAPRKSDEREGIRRNGIMVISAEGVEFEYLKQNRSFPSVTESFSMIHSTKPPPFHTLHIPYKKTGKNWRTRPVVITAAICLDFAHPSTLLLAEPDDPNEKSPPRRADVVLAPGKTWDVRIGEMMHEQVALRADEVGSIGLWCDRGGISGVVGRGESGAQRGVQTFMHTVSIPYDPEEKVQPHHATFYARMGDMASVLLLWVPLIGALLFPKLGIELGHPGGLQGEVNGNEHQPAIISGALLAVQRASAPVIAGGSASSHAIRAAIGNATAFVQRRFARNQPPAGNLIDF